jgi:predicted AAA+ superfamily ATPase
MPEMTHPDLTQEYKDERLYQYCLTYLQRDLRDIANIKDLNSFNIGQLINFSTIAKLASITSVTAKKFLSYLEISYQTLTLQPWHKNLNKRLVKSPKVHFLDPGIQRALLRRKSEINGHEYESAVIAEIYKQIKNHGLDVSLFHLRTLDDREIDLV